MDEYLWNQLDVEPPPSMCVQLECSGKLRSSLDSMCKEAKELLLGKSFRIEATFISRILHRYKNQFRLIKAFKFLRKINQTLLRVPKLNLKEVFSELASCISSEFMPSNQMVEFSMLRLQSLSFLLARLICTCEEVFLILKSYLEAPGPWDVWLTFQASISRIWVLSHHLLQKTDNWYEVLNRYRSKLDVTDHWLPESYSLPENLLSWVNQQLIKNGLSPLVVENIYKAKTANTVSAEFDSNREPSPTKSNMNEMDVKEFAMPKAIKGKRRGNRGLKAIKKKKKTSETTDIHSLDQLKKFLNTEVDLRSRSDSRQNCITKSLDPVEWDILRTILLKSIEKITKKPESSDKILGKVRQTLQVAIS
nr:PREDICTED: uncharacterized protein LOC109043174 [Bemisia tabaci]